MNKSILCLLVILIAGSVIAEPLPEEDVPDSLKPWIGWVLHGVEDTECPLVYNNLSEKRCVWPSALDISITTGRAVFIQKWEVYAEKKWMMLPGDRKFWPAQVTVNRKNRQVITTKEKSVLWVNICRMFIFLYSNKGFLFFLIHAYAVCSCHCQIRQDVHMEQDLLLQNQIWGAAGV